jgi:hypothetical protein
MTYDEIVSSLQTMCEVPLNGSDDNFQRIVPAMFLYADGRIYRELLFLANEITQPVQLSARNREVVLPPAVINLRGVNICTPVTTSITMNTIRTPLERIPPQVLDYLWPQPLYRPNVPQKYAMIGGVASASPPQMMQHVLRFMPTPDQPYLIEVLGDIRPDPLSPANPTTYLSVTYPELFLCACMIFAAGYQRDFGAQADDPQRAQSWQAQYDYLKSGVMLEVARMRGEGPGFTAEPPAPAAQPRAP